MHVKPFIMANKPRYVSRFWVTVGSDNTKRGARQNGLVGQGLKAAMVVGGLRGQPQRKGDQEQAPWQTTRIACRRRAKIAGWM